MNPAFERVHMDLDLNVVATLLCNTSKRVFERPHGLSKVTSKGVSTTSTTAHCSQSLDAASMMEDRSTSFVLDLKRVSWKDGYTTARIVAHRKVASSARCSPTST